MATKATTLRPRTLAFARALPIMRQVSTAFEEEPDIVQVRWRQEGTARLPRVSASLNRCPSFLRTRIAIVFCHMFAFKMSFELARSRIARLARTNILFFQRFSPTGESNVACVLLFRLLLQVPCLTASCSRDLDCIFPLHIACFLRVLCIWHCPFCADGPLRRRTRVRRRPSRCPKFAC